MDEVSQSSSGNWVIFGHAELLDTKHDRLPVGQINRQHQTEWNQTSRLMQTPDLFRVSSISEIEVNRFLNCSAHPVTNGGNGFIRRRPAPPSPSCPSPS